MFNKIFREVIFSYGQVPHLLHLPTNVLVKFFWTKINCLLPYPSVYRIILITLQVRNKCLLYFTFRPWCVPSGSTLMWIDAIKHSRDHGTLTSGGVFSQGRCFNEVFWTKINCLLSYPLVDYIILRTLRVQNKYLLYFTFRPWC